MPAKTEQVEMAVLSMDRKGKVTIIQAKVRPQGSLEEWSPRKVVAFNNDVDKLGLEEKARDAAELELRPNKTPGYTDDWFLVAWGGRDVRQLGGRPGGASRPLKSPEEGASIVAQVLIKEAAEVCRAEMTLGVHTQEGEPQGFNANKFRAILMDMAKSYQEVFGVILGR